MMIVTNVKDNSMFAALCLFAFSLQPKFPVIHADPADTMLIPAAILLEDPPGVPLYVGNVEQQKHLMSALSKLCVQRQLLDPREQRYVFVHDTDLESDLNMVRRRRVELANAPFLAEAAWLPDRALANNLISFNRSYLRHIERRMALELDLVPQLRVVISEINDCYKVWDYMRDARCESYYVTVRRHALLNVKKVLSQIEDEYGDYWQTRRLPPYVPHWRFQEMK
jgi:hypothetical protein